MRRRHIQTTRCYQLCLLGILIGVLPSANRLTAAEKPNVIFFLVDDLGWADLGCYGSSFHETPNIDRLADSGARLTQAYAACPVCSPTRASIMTGKHPVRVDITDWIPGKRMRPSQNPRFQHIEDRDNLALSEITLAEHLKASARYQTFFIGKWHLGDKGHLPTDQGFDINIGGFSKGSPAGGYYAPWTNPYLEEVPKGTYLTEHLTDKAVDLISNAQADQPYLLYMSYYNVHTPIQPDQRTLDYFTKKANAFEGETPVVEERDAVSRGRQDRADYASMVAAVDRSVGRILDAVEKLDQADNTIVIFFSDNGGLCTLPARNGKGAPTCNLPLRSGKGWLYEGGIREPCIVKAPGITTPGSVIEQPVVSMDFFPTILELVELPTKPNLHVDGKSFAGLLQQDSKKRQVDAERAFYWHYPHYHGSNWKPGAAVRFGDWKLIEFYETDETELYNLADDPSESKNLFTEQSAMAKQMSSLLKEWQSELNAKMPVPMK